MLNDYKPTHDPNIDTLQVQYLLGGSALLAVLFPYRYELTEVRLSIVSAPNIMLIIPIDIMGLLNLAGIRSHPPTTLHAAADRRSRNDYDALSVWARIIQGFIHPELVIQILCRRVCRSNSMDRWAGADNTVLGFLLDILYKVCIGLPCVLHPV